MKIPIKKYVMDESLSWEERYKQLEAHHKEETAWMVKTIRELENENKDLRAERSYANDNGYQNGA